MSHIRVNINTYFWDFSFLFKCYQTIIYHNYVLVKQPFLAYTNICLWGLTAHISTIGSHAVKAKSLCCLLTRTLPVSSSPFFFFLIGHLILGVSKLNPTLRNKLKVRIGCKIKTSSVCRKKPQLKKVKSKFMLCKTAVPNPLGHSPWVICYRAVRVEPWVWNLRFSGI